jgi:hypothetical protein
MLALYQGKPIEVLNRLVGSGAIPGKRDIVNTLLCIWLNQTKISSAYIYIYRERERERERELIQPFIHLSFENGHKLNLRPCYLVHIISRTSLSYKWDPQE